MKAIHGGKAKNDRSAAHKIAVLLHGGMLPQASVDPAEMRAPRDLLRRRMPLRRHRAGLLAHLHKTNSQDHLPQIGKQLAYKAKRGGVAERRCAPAVQNSIAVDLTLSGADDRLLTELELEIVNTAKESAGQRYGTAGAKIGHASLTWAFSEAAALVLRNHPAGPKYLARLAKNQGQGKALTVLAHQLGRAVHDMVRRDTACDLDKLFNA
jgi:hypothetical protein